MGTPILFPVEPEEFNLRIGLLIEQALCKKQQEQVLHVQTVPNGLTSHPLLFLTLYRCVAIDCFHLLLFLRIELIIMGSHPVNLLIRFLLELTALAATGLWGWKQSESWFRFVLAIGIPLIVAVVWGTFNVPNDPSRSGAAPIIVPGVLRLAIELAIFTFAVWAFYNSGHSILSWILAIIVAVHYIVSYDRVQWLIAH